MNQYLPYAAADYVRPTFAGVGYPMRDDGIVALVHDAKAINAGLTLLFLTEPGDRLNELSFGTPLRDLLFEEVESNLSEIARRVAVAISQWEPRITLVSLTGQANNSSVYDLPIEVTSETGENEYGVRIRFRWEFKVKLGEAHEFNNLVGRGAQT